MKLDIKGSVLAYISVEELKAIEEVTTAVAFVQYVRKWARDREFHRTQFDIRNLTNNVIEEMEEQLEAAKMYSTCIFTPDDCTEENGATDAVKAYIDGMIDAVVYATADTVRTHPDWKPLGLDADTSVSLSAFMSPVLPFLSHTPPELRVLALVTELTHYVEDPYTAVIQEVLKEITSRRGAFDDEAGKWVKDKSKPTYSADFKFDPSYVAQLWQAIDSFTATRWLDATGDTCDSDSE